MMSWLLGALLLALVLCVVSLPPIGATSSSSSSSSSSHRRQQRLLQSKANMRERLDKLRHSESLTHSQTQTQAVVGFYHIFADPDGHYERIVQEQLDVIQRSGLYEQLHAVYYNTIGGGGKGGKLQQNNYSLFPSALSSSPSSSKYVHLMHLGDVGEEVETISALFEYCRDHERAKVFYFHDKGSFHPNHQNDLFRRYLDCYVLNPSCISALDEFDTCGMRVSPTPFIHYSGNFWWATCSYVNKLIDPMSLERNETFKKVTETIAGCVYNGPRYFPETWIGSGPNIRPADCINSELDTSYLYAYSFPPSFNNNCPSADNKFGSSCGLASTLKNAELFSGAYEHMRELEPKVCAQTNVPREIRKRSMYWYGQPPTTYDSWISRIEKMRNLTDGTAIRGARDVQCYYFKNGEIRAIPSAAALFKLGLTFDDIVVIPTYQVYLLKQGPSL